MRRQLTAYVGGDDFARLKEEAEEAGLSLSRYIQERLVHSNGQSTISLSESKLVATEKRIIDANRSFIAQAIRPLSKQVTMLLAMLDQFALSMLTHLPEIPEAQREQALASGERRHHGWRLEARGRGIFRSFFREGYRRGWRSSRGRQVLRVDRAGSQREERRQEENFCKRAQAICSTPHNPATTVYFCISDQGMHFGERAVSIKRFLQGRQR